LKKIDLGQIIGILANVGVIAGIIFLGVELQQNNELLAAQGRASRAEVAQGLFLRLMENPSVAQAAAKALDGEQLDRDETLVLMSFHSYILTSWQYTYGEYQRRLIDEIPIRAWRNLFQGIPGLAEYWRQNAADNHDPDFYNFMNENVAG
jgi:hypothetical protein